MSSVAANSEQLKYTAMIERAHWIYAAVRGVCHVGVKEDQLGCLNYRAASVSRSSRFAF